MTHFSESLSSRSFDGPRDIGTDRRFMHMSAMDTEADESGQWAPIEGFKTPDHHSIVDHLEGTRAAIVMNQSLRVHIVQNRPSKTSRLNGIEGFFDGQGRTVHSD